MPYPCRRGRLYGTCERFVPLPERALVDKAAATFKNGVLEVKVPLGEVANAEPGELPIS